MIDEIYNVIQRIALRRRYGVASFKSPENKVFFRTMTIARGCQSDGRHIMSSTSQLMLQTHDRK
jgi:hypothetical protein